MYDFDSVSKATRLENEIRELWQQYAKLQNMRDAYRHNRDRYNESQMAKRMNVLTLDMNHAIRLWEAETGKQWTIWHYRATDPDPVTTAAWDTLGQSLNAQLDADMQEMVDLWEVWQDAKADNLENRTPIVGVAFSDTCHLDWFVTSTHIGQNEP